MIFNSIFLCNNSACVTRLLKRISVTKNDVNTA